MEAQSNRANPKDKFLSWETLAKEADTAFLPEVPRADEMTRNNMRRLRKNTCLFA